MVGVYEVCPCEGLPGVADVAGVLDGGGGEADRVAFDGGGGRMKESVILTRYGAEDGTGGSDVLSVSFGESPACKTFANRLLASRMNVERVAMVRRYSHARVVNLLHKAQLAVAEPRP